MRYLIAIVCGFVAVALTARFIAPWLAPLVTGTFTYESPDGEAFVEQAVFVGAMLVALTIGWGIGWIIGGALERPDKPL